MFIVIIIIFIAIYIIIITIFDELGINFYSVLFAYLLIFYSIYMIMNVSDNKPLAVVLLSGGMDSALCAGIAKADGFDIAALHLNYGQLTEKRELRAFNDLCDHYEVKARISIDTTFLSDIGGSSLTDNTIPIPSASFVKDAIPNTYVPFRNANILCLAVSWAEVIGAEAIFIGAVEEDSSGYPDCRISFFEAFQNVINLGTKDTTRIIIKTPIINYSKEMIVSEALRLNVPLELTWSCYQGTDYACGVCESCLLRLKGFAGAGAIDPIPYSNLI